MGRGEIFTVSGRETVAVKNKDATVIGGTWHQLLPAAACGLILTIETWVIPPKLSLSHITKNSLGRRI